MHVYPMSYSLSAVDGKALAKIPRHKTGTKRHKNLIIRSSFVHSEKVCATTRAALPPWLSKCRARGAAWPQPPAYRPFDDAPSRIRAGRRFQLTLNWPACGAVLVMPRAESPLRPRAYSALRSQRCVWWTPVAGSNSSSRTVLIAPRRSAAGRSKWRAEAQRAGLTLPRRLVGAAFQRARHFVCRFLRQTKCT